MTLGKKKEATTLKSQKGSERYLSPMKYSPSYKVSRNPGMWSVWQQRYTNEWRELHVPVGISHLLVPTWAYFLKQVWCSYDWASLDMPLKFRSCKSIAMRDVSWEPKRAGGGGRKGERRWVDMYVSNETLKWIPFSKVF